MLWRGIMGHHIFLTYVTIQNTDNYRKYIPIIRKFNHDSLSDIKENIVNRSHVISFDLDRADIESKREFVSTLESLIDAGAELILFKDFYNEVLDNKEKREIPLESILKTDEVSIQNFLRVPVKIKQLVRFSEHELNMYALYVTSDFKTVNKDTLFYLDDHVEVDDNDNELYPQFATENNLEIYFHGDIASGIIGNTRHQLDPKSPSVNDYIKNFNHYDKHDCFLDFG